MGGVLNYAEATRPWRTGKLQICRFLGMNSFHPAVLHELREESWSAPNSDPKILAVRKRHAT